MERLRERSGIPLFLAKHLTAGFHHIILWKNLFRPEMRDVSRRDFCGSILRKQVLVNFCQLLSRYCSPFLNIFGTVVLRLPLSEERLPPGLPSAHAAERRVLED